MNVAKMKKRMRELEIKCHNQGVTQAEKEEYDRLEDTLAELEGEALS